MQVAQAAELLSTAAATELPVVMLGDFNTSAVPGQPNDTPTYELLLGAGFEDTWNQTQTTESFTCCQAPDLRNDASILDSRIDLILTRGPLEAIDADVVGEEASDRTAPLPTAPAGLWPSDHAGVLAKLVIPSRQQVHHQIQFVDFGPPVVGSGSDGGEQEAGLLDTVGNRPRFSSQHELDDVWNQTGRRQREMRATGSDRVRDTSFHDDDDVAMLVDLLVSSLAHQDSKMGV